MTDTVAEEWFQRGSRDLAVAKLLIDEEEYLDAAIFHIHQAVEKYLKGFLISHKWELKKVHDLEFLITEAMKHERRPRSISIWEEDSQASISKSGILQVR